MKIAHLSDTHLGYPGHGLQRWIEDPARPGISLRQGEADIADGLRRAIDRIVTVVRPDLVLHTGDLFDGPRPSAHSVETAMEQFKRLSTEGIPTLIIEGTHSSPRDRAQGHPLRLLAYLSGVAVVCDDAEPIRIGSALVHPHPHNVLAQGKVPQRQSIGADCANILAAHAVADGLRIFRGPRPTPDLDLASCAAWYDYVALGHYHLFSQAPGTDNAFYAGATAMVTPGDFHPGYRFGFVVIDFAEVPVRIERLELETRSMHTYGIDDATGLAPEDILARLDCQAKAVSPHDTYCQVVVEGMDPAARRVLARREVEEIFANHAGLMLRLEARQPTPVRGALGAGGDPFARFAALAAADDGDDAFKADLSALGTQLLHEAQRQIVEADAAEGRGTREV